MSDQPEPPHEAVAGLGDVLRALGDELRDANRQVGEYTYEEDGETVKQPILFFDMANVEVTVAVTGSAGAGLKFWVVNAEAGIEHARTVKISITLNANGQILGMGQ